jgi:hypothetical protein
MIQHVDRDPDSRSHSEVVACTLREIRERWADLEETEAPSDTAFIENRRPLDEGKIGPQTKGKPMTPSNTANDPYGDLDFLDILFGDFDETEEQLAQIDDAKPDTDPYAKAVRFIDTTVKTIQTDFGSLYDDPVVAVMIAHGVLCGAIEAVKKAAGIDGLEEADWAANGVADGLRAKGYTFEAETADMLCRLLEDAEDLDEVPDPSQAGAREPI